MRDRRLAACAHTFGYRLGLIDLNGIVVPPRANPRRNRAR
jgi:hypothetical protein